jgi:hypothetical protein
VRRNEVRRRRGSEEGRGGGERREEGFLLSLKHSVVHHEFSGVCNINFEKYFITLADDVVCEVSTGCGVDQRVFSCDQVILE